MGVVINPGSTYHIQNNFHVEGYFDIKVTPSGPSLCLLKGDGDIKALVDEGID